MGHNIEQGAGGDWRFVEIQRFCDICPKTFETDCIYWKNAISSIYQKIANFQYVENSKLSMVSIHQNNGIVSIYRRNDILSNSICEKLKGCHVLPKQAMF
jgi:hypothetical protein